MGEGRIRTCALKVRYEDYADAKDKQGESKTHNDVVACVYCQGYHLEPVIFRMGTVPMVPASTAVEQVNGRMGETAMPATSTTTPGGFTQLARAELVRLQEELAMMEQRHAIVRAQIPHLQAYLNAVDGVLDVTAPMEETAPPMEEIVELTKVKMLESAIKVHDAIYALMEKSTEPIGPQFLAAQLRKKGIGKHWRNPTATVGTYLKDHRYIRLSRGMYILRKE